MPDLFKAIEHSIPPIDRVHVEIILKKIRKKVAYTLFIIGDKYSEIAFHQTHIPSPLRPPAPASNVVMSQPPALAIKYARYTSVPFR